MKSKKVLTLLLALCLVVSMIAPSAAAATVGGDNRIDASILQESSADSADTSGRGDNSLLVSKEDAVTNGISTLRGTTPSGTTESTDETKLGGAWTASPSDTDVSVSIKATELPDCIEELQKAAEIYDENDIVAAFIVMENAPLAATYNAIDRVPVGSVRVMTAQQNAMITAIEDDVLDGGELDVRYQFTYLTNSITVRTEFGNLEKIATMDGVKSVFLMPVYNPCETETPLNPTTASSGEMSGVPSVWADCGYTGTGMKIAIIDSGLDLDHPSFAADPATNENSMTLADVEAVLGELNAAKRLPSVTASQLYRSVKVPFAFNYVDESLTADHSRDTAGYHGTHVAGIAAANPVEGTDVVGMAPDAQIVVMKVFGANGGAYTDDILAALEDAMRLDCDVVNMSLGSPAGFTSEDPEIDAIYERISQQDIIVAVAAGNEGTSAYDNMWGTDLNRTSDPDNGSVASPATYINTTVVASADNAMAMSTYFVADGTKIAYYDGSGLYTLFADLGTDPLEYVMIDGLGYAEDFEGVDVEGKIAVVSRGTITFAQKLANAEAAGAIGLIVWNNTDELIGMQLTDDSGNLPAGVSGDVPAVIISKASGQILADAAEKVLTIAAEPGPVADPAGGQMSSFSSWGVSPDLRLLPDITGVGGNIYSTIDDGLYEVMSGTSMATPQVAGISALILQYLHETCPDASDSEIRTMADSLLMSTAVPVVSNVTGLEASPRQQGAGLVNALNAVTAGAYLTVDGCDKPKAELGDSENGTYSFTFRVNNLSGETKTYTLDASLLTEEYTLIDGQEYMSGVEHQLSGSVSFDQSTVTVAAGSTAVVNVTVTLSAEDKAWMDAHYENGIYVEGFVYLENADEAGVDLSLPFLGFYGDWTKAPVFDTAYWYSDSFWRDDVEPDGSEYFHIFWTDLDGVTWVLGFNPYVAIPDDYDSTVDYDPAHNVISNNGDNVLEGIDEIYLSLMRNAKKVTFTYTDEAGNVVHEDVLDYVTKTMYISAYGQVVPMVYSWYADMYDFTDDNGNPLPNNTKLMLTITAEVDYGDEGTAHVMQVPITIDTQAPILDTTNIVETSVDGRNYLTLTISENVDLANVFVVNPAGTRILGEQPEYTKNEDGTYTVVLDITGFGTEMNVILCDYGANEAVYSLSYSADANLPEVDRTALYAYRVSDFSIMDDSMYGWVTIGKEDASVTAQTNDYLEYYALTAAEYAGGYVFAVDAGYNLVAMVPGLWNRVPICNLGASALDMTFDKTTNTMYVVLKVDSYDVSLCAIDLLSGELTTLKQYYYVSYAPWAMAAADDGTIYAVKQGSSGLWKLNDTYDLEAVTDADGNQIKLTASTGSSVYPYYSQSMTYSSEDQRIYWAYYSYTGASELFTIDPETLTYSSVPFASISEYVGLLTLDEDSDFEIPKDSALTGLLLSDESLLMMQGKNAQLTVNPIPWNTALGEVTWTSADESVATVSESGVVTAVGEGVTAITASCGDVSATCYVTVVCVEGTVYAYNYYSGDGSYGDWLSLDLASLTRESLYWSPVDFIAADYNGHDGNIYGYDEMGQFYRFNPETGECTALGTPASDVPFDMAYDYSTGLMYAIVVDQYSYTTTLSYVNMNTGELIPAAQTYNAYVALACDTDGLLFAVTSEGELVALLLVPGSSGGIMPFDWDDDDWGDDWGDEYPEDDSLMIQEIPILDGFGYPYILQSMCYDHNTGKLVWACPDLATVLWIDPYAEEPYAIELGDPTRTGIFEYLGLYSIPEEIPELPYFPVESVETADMVVLVGGSKTANVTINPLNATNQNIVWTSADETVATVDENGMIVGVSKGKTTITGTLTDEENVFDLSFQVTVLDSADNIYGFIVTDIATYGGDVWAEIYDTDPTAPYYVEMSDYLLYAEEYHDGKLYAYGYDEYDWASNWQFIVMDAETFAVESLTDMGAGFPFVYDMTYDYATGTMFALAGYNDTSSDVYMVNMANGKLVPVMQTEEFFMSIAASADGTLYAMRTSEEEGDYWDSWLTNAMLYKLDINNGTTELVGDTGVQSNGLASMAFDFDTGNLYWTALNMNNLTGGLHMVDTETGAAINLGSIGPAGAQVSGLFILADAYPEEPEPVLQNVKIATTSETILVGDSKQLESYVLPLSAPAELTWTSADESIASVDENGVVTGVGAGVTTVTVTAADGVTTVSATCAICVLDPDASFLSYNRTEHGWAKINIMDPTQVTIANTEDADLAEIRAAAYVGDVIYAFDAEGNFVSITDTDTFERTYLGSADVEIDADLGERFEIHDLAYDSANDRLLALGAVYAISVYGWEEEYDIIYEVDLTNGHLTELYSFAAEGYTYIPAMTVTADGSVYVYTCFDSYFIKVDLNAGTATKTATLRTLSAYGDSDYPQAMCYDPVTCMVYILLTTNGSYYQLYSYNPANNAMAKVGNVGEVTYANWKYNGDGFAALLLPGEHIHAWDAWQTISEPTCTEDGLRTHTCLLCGEVETEVIPALGHDWNGWFVTKEATCEEAGEEFRICSVCGETELREIPALGHDYVAVVTEPTCTEGGYTTYTCSRCGDTYVSDYTDALGHDWSDWVVTKEATCEEAGEEARICSVCGETETREIPALGHDYVAVVTPPTTESEGYTTHTCTRCGDSYVDSYTAKLPAEDSGNSQTGDSFNVALWTMLVLISVAGVSVLLLNRKKWFRG